MVTFSEELTMDSEEADDLLSQILFICPTARKLSTGDISEVEDERLELNSSPHFQGVPQLMESSVDYYKRLDPNHHHVLPLFWCNNKEDSVHTYDTCGACNGDSRVDSDYYFCGKCNEKYHKECVESPFQIRHPYHPKHTLQLYFFAVITNHAGCTYCGKDAHKLFYYCNLCDFGMHPVCALKPVIFVIDQPKRHDHSLTLFTRKASLDCDVCGLMKAFHPTYICLICNFISHRDCAYFPHVIRISRHHHRISFNDSLPHIKWSCGVCRQNVDNDYGAYTCNKCDDYVAHSRCALREDVWDGIELDGVPEEEDIDEDVEPFKRISDGLILHFSHDHHLKLETSGVYDDQKICEACVLPIYEGDFYSCIECNFILHDTCANAPCRKRHPLHPHPLTLKVINGHDDDGQFECNACNRTSCGFIYQCSSGRGCFKLDVRCASISEPLDYEGHEHPLFLALDPAGGRNCCQVCKRSYGLKLLNCIVCDFIICFNCVTLPYKARYKHDKHFLTIGYVKEGGGQDWCEVCERKLPSGQKQKVYTCNHCCVSLHIECLLGEDMYMNPGHTIILGGGTKALILPNNSLSRPFCDYCGRRCADKKIYIIHSQICCQMRLCLYTSLRRILMSQH